MRNNVGASSHSSRIISNPPHTSLTKTAFEVEIQTEDYNVWYDNPGLPVRSPNKHAQKDRYILASPRSIRQSDSRSRTRIGGENEVETGVRNIVRTLDFDEDSSIDSDDVSTQCGLSCCISNFWRMFTEHFILVALAAAVVIAFLFPDIGTKASSLRLGYQNYGLIEFINNVLVFLVSGLTLKIEEMQALWRHKYLILYGLITINFMTTLAAFGTQQIPFETNEFAIGLTIFVTVPTTLGIGVALTYASKGDVILSLFLTVASNVLGIITVPYLLKFYFSSNLVRNNILFNHHADSTSTASADVIIDPTTLAYRLTLTVLVPTIVGILIRKMSTTVIRITKEYRELFSMFSMANLMCMVWMSLSKSKDTVMKQSIREILMLLAVNIGIHIFYLMVNYVVTYQLFGRCCGKVPIKQAIALMIMASQKSSPVALSVIAIVAESNDVQGLMTIPCILGQLSQIFIGYIYSRWLSKYVSRLETELGEATETRTHGNGRKRFISHDSDDSSTRTIASSSIRRTKISRGDSQQSDSDCADIPAHVYIDI
jgi:sodium/bile acid cotransporter 7